MCAAPINIRLHDAITLAYGGAGWCALSADGRLRVTLLDPAADMNRVVILLDGEPLGGAAATIAHATASGSARSIACRTPGATPSTSPSA